MMTTEQQQQIASIKRSVEILRAVARNCQDLEAADDVMREANMIAAKLAVLEGTPQTTPAAVAA